MPSDHSPLSAVVIFIREDSIKLPLASAESNNKPKSQNSLLIFAEINQYFIFGWHFLHHHHLVFIFSFVNLKFPNQIFNSLDSIKVTSFSSFRLMSKSQQLDNDNKNDKLLFERQADFAFDLLRLVATKTGNNDKGDENENGIISPLSISIALAMVYVGAEGETAEELAKLLTDAPNSVEQKLKTQQFFGGLCQEFLHKKIQEEEKARKEAEEEEKKKKRDEEEIKRKDDEEDQNKYAPPPPPPDEEEKEIKEIICEYGDEKCKCIVALANKIYLAKGYPILENYKATIGQYYAGLFEQLDFEGEQSIKSINDFVESMTCKKIKNFFDPNYNFDCAKLLLINAVYFKGFWNKKFCSKATEKKIFHFSESKQKMIDMMHQEDYFSYAENSQFQMLGMPYVDDEARMYILLPRKRFGLGKMLKTMNGKEFLKLIRKMKKCQLVDLNLPKFKLESSFMMNNELEKLGLETAFNADKANFEGIVGAKNGDKGERGNLHISETFQKAFIEVNEEGSEAAGVSRIVYEWQNFCGFDGPSREPKPIKFNADHPFAFVLFLPIIKWKKENENGHFLFVGTYPKHCGETEIEHESEQSASNSSRKSSMGHRIWERITKKLKKF